MMAPRIEDAVLANIRRESVGRWPVRCLGPSVMIKNKPPSKLSMVSISEGDCISLCAQINHRIITFGEAIHDTTKRL